MQIELTGLRTTLWFAKPVDYLGSSVTMLFARVWYKGREYVCATSRLRRLAGYRVPQHCDDKILVVMLGLGRTTEHSIIFRGIQHAKAYAIAETIRRLANQEERRGVLMLADMYSVWQYADWEPICLSK